MKLKRFSDPFTGAPIDAIQFEQDVLIFDAPLKGDKIECRIIEDHVQIPLKCFEHVELIDAKEAAMELHVSRQRMIQLVESETLKPVYLGKTQYFALHDVLEYKKIRKNGRPKKV